MDIANSEILELVRRTLTPEQIQRSIIYWYDRVLQEGAPIKVGLQSLAMPFEGTIVFVDLAPRANWAHPCLYLLIENKTLNSRIIEGSFPPSIDESSDNFMAILRYGKELPREQYSNVLSK